MEEGMFFNMLQYAKLLLCYMLAYGLSVTLSGAIKAWVAKKAGDHTAEYAGYLSLDPFVHIDLLGLMALLITGFGWGSEVPVDVYNIRSPLRDVKILIVYYIQTIAHILFTTISILCLAGIEVFQFISLDQTTSGAIVRMVLQALITVNMFLAMLRFIQGSADLICMHFIERDPGSVLYIRLGSLLVTMIILLLIGHQMQMFFANISTTLAVLVLKLFA